MKQPVEPDEIRMGDKIRWERAQGAKGQVVSYEYVASCDGDGIGLGPGQRYLLERPEPAVVLPETPTLGWLESGAGPLLGVWERYGRASHPVEVAIQWERKVEAAAVTSFTPAVAVPAEAIDRLREIRKAWSEGREMGMHELVDLVAAADAVIGDQ